MMEDKRPHDTNTAAESDVAVEVLNQEIDDERGLYRIQRGRKIGYLTILTDVFDEATMNRPYLLIPNLPPLAECEWTHIRIERDLDGNLDVKSINEPLAAVETLWHNQFVDIVSLKEIKYIRSGVKEVVYEGGTAIAKYSTFDWHMYSMERETWAYSVLDKYQRDHPEEASLTPKVLGHLTEEGRPMGLLLEKLEGEYASIEDLEECGKVVRKIHSIGLVHGDVNRYNFIVDKQRGEVKIVDFEHAAAFDEQEGRMELESLRSELEEETGRGKPAEM